ncbi:MAG: TIGR04086 family membrane protein [Clostridia bacterium]|nr:TIGR04086 family membrane protein [Clostridia bacterium]
METRKSKSPVRGNADGVSEGFTFTSALAAAGKGLAFMSGAAVILMLAGAAIAYSAGNPTALTMPISLVCLLLSFFIGGIAAARSAKNARLLSGTLFNAFALLILLLVRLIASGKGASSIESSGAYLTGAVAASALGSFVALFAPAQRRGKRKKNGKITRKKRK